MVRANPLSAASKRSHRKGPAGFATHPARGTLARCAPAFMSPPTTRKGSSGAPWSRSISRAGPAALRITKLWCVTTPRPTPPRRSPPPPVRKWCTNRIARSRGRAMPRPPPPPVCVSFGSMRMPCSRRMSCAERSRLSGRADTAAAVRRWNLKVRSWAGARGGRSMLGIGSRARSASPRDHTFSPRARGGCPPAASTRKCTRARNSDSPANLKNGGENAGWASVFCRTPFLHPRAKCASSLPPK